MKNINSFHESLLNRGKVLSKKQIISAFNKYKKIKDIKNKDIVRYLSKNNYIQRIFLGYYYIKSLEERARKKRVYSDRELLFIVLNQEKIKWYLGLNTALYEQGKTWQTPVKLNVVNNKISGERTILGLKVKFYKTKEDLIFGVKEKETKNKVKYYYSDPAKTYLDKVYFKQTDKLKRLKNTKKYLERFPKWVGMK